MEILEVHPEYSGTKLAKELDISAKAVEKHLANLKAEGRLVHDGPDKGGKWIIEHEETRQCLHSPSCARKWWKISRRHASGNKRP